MIRIQVLGRGRQREENQKCDNRSRCWNLKVEGGEVRSQGTQAAARSQKRQLGFSPRASADTSMLDLQDLLTFRLPGLDRRCMCIRVV